MGPVHRYSAPLIASVALAGALTGAERCTAQAVFQLTVTDTLMAPGDITEIPVLFHNFGSDDVQGWSYGVCHDDWLLEILAAEMGSTTEVVNNGYPPDFLALTVLPNGYTMGVVVTIPTSVQLPPGTGYELSIGIYTSVPSTAGTTQICICSSLGVVPIDTVIVVSGQAYTPAVGCGLVDVAVPPPPPSAAFVRGDANDDGLLNIADVVWILIDLFGGGPHTDCDGANDVNADGIFNIADALYLIARLFGPGPDPAPPFPDCGTTPVMSDCVGFTSC